MKYGQYFEIELSDLQIRQNRVITVMGISHYVVSFLFSMTFSSFKISAFVRGVDS